MLIDIKNYNKIVSDGELLFVSVKRKIMEKDL